MKRVFFMHGFVFLVLTMIISLMPRVAFSQTNHRFSGRIVDGSTGEPLSNATVTVLKTQQQQFTDEAGDFLILTDEDSITIAVSSLGYETQENTYHYGDDILIQMALANRMLDETVVVGY